MALSKKQRVLSIQIYKVSSSCYDWQDEEKLISGSIKVPFVRTLSTCENCVFYIHCATWNPNFRINGLVNRIGLHKCECRHHSGEYNFPTTGSKFNYLVPYRIASVYLPIEILKELGIYVEPKIKKTSSNNYVFNQRKAQYSYSKYSKPKNYIIRKH